MSHYGGVPATTGFAATETSSSLYERAAEAMAQVWNGGSCMLSPFRVNGLPAAIVSVPLPRGVHAPEMRSDSNRIAAGP